MAMVPLKNNGKTPLLVAGMMIQPGETRQVESYLVPPYLRPNAPKPAAPKTNKDDVLALLDQAVPKVIEAFPSLSDEDFERLQLAEENGKTRKSLMNAFAEEKLRRANEKVGGSADDTDPPTGDNGPSDDDQDPPAGSETSEDADSGSEGAGDADNKPSE